MNPEQTIDQLGLLAGIQEACAERLRTDGFFTNIEVITERLGDIEKRINQSLGSIKAGICVIIVTPVANVTSPNLAGPYFGEVKVVVRVIENTIINRSATGTQKPASKVAEIVCARLHNFTPDGFANITCDNPTIALGNDPKNLSYDCLFTTHGGIEYTPDRETD
jgi:hypothetical protein